MLGVKCSAVQDSPGVTAPVGSQPPEQDRQQRFHPCSACLLWSCSSSISCSPRLTPAHSPAPSTAGSRANTAGVYPLQLLGRPCLQGQRTDVRSHLLWAQLSLKAAAAAHSWGLKLPCQPSHSISYWIFWGNINAGRRWLPLWQQHPPSLVLQAHCPHTSCAPDSDLLFAKTFPGKGCKTLTQGNHGVTVPGILQGVCRCGR